MTFRSSKQSNTDKIPNIPPPPPPPVIDYVTSTLKIKKEPSYLKQFNNILKYKNVPNYYLVQDVKDPYALSKLSLSKLPGTKRIKKWEKLR